MTNHTHINPLEAIVPHLQSVLETFDIYAIAIFLLPGLFLNLLTIFVFCRRKFWKRTTMGYYYTVSTLFSTFAVVVAFVEFFPAALHKDLLLKSTLLCKAIWIAQTQSIYGSGYFRILITLDLMLNTLYPMKFRFLNKISNLIKLTVLIQVSVAVSNAVQYWRHLKYTPVDDKNNTEIVVTCTLTHDFLIVHDFAALLSRVIPSISNVAMNMMIIRVLVRSKRNVSKAKDRSSSKENTFAYSLVAQNFIFFVVTLPHIVLSLTQIIFDRTDYEDIMSVLYGYGIWSSFIFESIPFYMNLAFNRLFRVEFCLLFKLKNMVGPADLSGSISRNKTTRVNTGAIKNIDNSSVQQ